MKRKTFVKQLMALGLSRNDANDMCRGALLRGAISFVAYGNALAFVSFAGIYGVHLTGRLLTMEERRKFRTWRRKRTKLDPIIAWQKNHPSEIQEVPYETMAK